MESAQRAGRRPRDGAWSGLECLEFEGFGHVCQEARRLESAAPLRVEPDAVCQMSTLLGTQPCVQEMAWLLGFLHSEWAACQRACAPGVLHQGWPAACASMRVGQTKGPVGQLA